MRILVTGVNGQLGYDVVKALKYRNIECIGVGRTAFDITKENDVKKYILNYKPDAVIHCAAYTAVDKAEDEHELCHMVNVCGTENIAKACRAVDAKMVYISTDYVFPGDGIQSYNINDNKGPLGIYGKTKLEGENAVKKILEKYFIIRISWVFGINGNNFVKTMLHVGKDRSEINVVSDQIGSPTYTVDLAKLICDMVVTDKYGIYHATNEGYCSWAEFAEEIFKLAGYNTKINYIKTSEYHSKAVRPLNSKLDKTSLDKAGFKRLPHWKDALKRYLKEISDYEEHI
ncbi:MAG: dTDP-4-dehydrorhamnose reductase [Clostridia bacterium]|jgi:dTDP-4-dehydrorhamnose reductase|nr:dTDP-4-dehydrorhamnose reductase [Clostridia bacterium]